MSSSLYYKLDDIFFFPVGDGLWREGNEGRTVHPRSINPAYGPEQKRLKQYTMIPCETIANAMINNVLNTKKPCHLHPLVGSFELKPSPR